MNIENYEIQIEKSNTSGHILLLFFSIYSHFPHVRVKNSAFSFICELDTDILNSSKHSRLSHERRTIQNNVTQTWGELKMMIVGHEENVTRNIVFLYSYLIIVLLSRQWNRDIMDLSKQHEALPRSSVTLFNTWTLIAIFKLWVYSMPVSGMSVVAIQSEDCVSLAALQITTL